MDAAKAKQQEALLRMGNGDDDGVDMMDMDGDEKEIRGKAAKKGKVSEEFKALVLKVLQESGFEEQRAAKMTQDQFMSLLAAFNKAGIHFS